MKIFGYDWEDIQRAQRGGRLVLAELGAPQLPIATDDDVAAYNDCGGSLDALRAAGMHGMVDRLVNSGY